MLRLMVSYEGLLEIILKRTCVPTRSTYLSVICTKSVRPTFIKGVVSKAAKYMYFSVDKGHPITQIYDVWDQGLTAIHLGDLQYVIDKH